MRELAQELLTGQDAWVVGGAVRDALLGRELVDLDIACAEPEKIVRRHADLVTKPAGERVLAELLRLSAAGYRRLAALGLLERLGGSVDERLDRADSPDYRLVAVFGAGVENFPISNEQRRYA